MEKQDNFNRQNLVDEFNEALSNDRIKSITIAAKSMGISPAVLSQYRKGEYSGNLDRIDQLVAGYLDLLKKRIEVEDEEVPFVFTWNAKKVYDIAQMVHMNRMMGVVVGRAGFGKTAALLRYTDEFPGVVYLEVDTAYSGIELMMELDRKLGGDGKGTLNDLKNRIINKFTNSGRLLIIDQAEYMSEKALDLIRTIHDKSRVGVLFTGLPRLIQNMKGAKGVLEQVYTRIGASIELKPLSEADVETIVRQHMPDINGYAPDLVQFANGNARVLTLLMRNSKRLAKAAGKPIDREVIAKANSYLIK